MQFRSLAEVLEARKHSGDTGIRFIETSTREDFLSYRDLYRSASGALAFLQSKGIKPGDELVFQLEDNKTFIVVFWACLLGGVIPVPLSVGQNDDHKQKLFNVWGLLNNPFLVSTGAVLDKLEAFARQRGLGAGCRDIRTKSIDATGATGGGGAGEIWRAEADDIAFIQFSSGSTGSPKGVVLTHRNLIANLEAISEAAGYSARDAMLSWMPLSHDMGLIGFHLNPVFSGMNHCLMPTNLFIRRPGLWLDKASEHKVSILCSPNFGYKYVLKHCDPAGSNPWDLSPVRLLYNGAEPISETLCRDFLRSLSGYGLRSRAMCPVYGLAEASLAVAISGMDDEVMAVEADRSKLRVGDPVAGPEAGENPVSFVNVGRAIAHCAVRITDGADAVLDEGRVGHVQIRGANVTAGYYNNEAATRQVLTADGWLRTGDLGFLRAGALYITGRAKDIIFVNGQNFYPHDLERLAEAVEGIELNKIVVAGFSNDQDRKEETVAFVFHRGSLEAFVPVAKALRAQVNRAAGFEIDRIIPVKDIPRTTSGKLQRFKLIEQLRSGAFDDVERGLAGWLAAATPDAAPPQEPANDDERRLLTIWKTVLGANCTGVTQAFFETGGNSLKAAEAAMLIQQEFGVVLALEHLYRIPTVRELARALNTLAVQAYRPIPPARQAAYYPVSAAQKRLYYAWALDKDATAYNIPVAFRIVGAVDAARLESCIKRLVTRHDSLRMSFRMTPAPAFAVQDHVPFRLARTACPPGQVQERLAGMVRPFHLEEAPLWRVALLTTGAGECILFLDFHHLISDGISVRHFVEELMALYAGEELPGLPAGYRDFALWEAENPPPAEIASREAYWLDQLRGKLPVLELPTDFQRPPVVSTRGAKAAFSLPPEATGKLRRLADASGCTLHVLLFTAYNVLLSKYTGQEDLVTGIPVSGRRHPDTQKMQGMFVNNLAVRSRVRGEDSFAGLLEDTRRRMAGALRHQEYPFDALLGRLGEKRDASRNPVFDTMFVYQNMGLPDAGRTGLTLSRHFFDPGYAKFDLSLEVFEDGDGLECAFEYATALFTEETIGRLAGHFRRLLDVVVADPGRKVADLSVLDPEAYERYVLAFNRTESIYPSGTTIHQLFEAQAARTPDAVAVAYGAQRVTYRQLNERAARLAGRLRARGMGPNQVAAVLLRRSPDLIVSILGVLKAGGCYLPIQAGTPAGRTGYLVADSRCRFLITDAPGAAWALGLPEVRDCEVIVAGEEGDAPGAGPLEPVNGPTDLAYVIYTSGTTGRPKGVMIEHRSLVNYITWAAAQYVQGEKADFPLYTSIAFDLTVTSVFTPLVTGNAIVVYGEDENDLPLERILRDNKTAVVKLTPSHLKLLRALPLPAAGSSIRRFVVGGEQLETGLAREIHDKFGGNVEIYNEYGPTEATVGCMIHRFDPRETRPNVPVGVPAANTRIYLLDAFLQPVPVGVHGEMYIAGDGVARGYLFQEALTAQKFVPDPFAEGRKMYKTGDMARQLPSGRIEYIGRHDHQVKINGYRVEPSEIEKQLAGHPGVVQALVTVKTNPTGQPGLYAYYQIAAGPEQAPGEADLRDYLADRLPHYMMPVAFIPLQRMPLTPNGKVDLEALPEPDRPESDSPLPRNEIEAVSLQVWEAVLGGQNLRVTDNFFERGGDSIKAVQIASRLAGRGIQLEVKHILTYHTIAQASRHARAAGAAGAYAQGIVQGEKGLFPIERWFTGQHFSNPHYYNQSVLLRLNRNADAGLLAKAFTQLVAHHDGLRMNYDPGKGTLFYNNRYLEAAFVIEQLALPPGDGHSEGGAASGLPGLLLPVKNSFSLTRSLLIRAALVTQSDAPDLLFITAHHLVTDGVSWRILLEDLHAVYEALEKGVTPQLPPKTAALTDWEKKLAQYAGSGALEGEEAYWQQVENTPFELPCDFRTDEWQVEHLGKTRATLDPEKTRFLLGEAHRTYHTDVPILLNAALALALREWTGSNAFVVEQENHGRHLEGMDTARTVGWFTALFPVRLVLEGEALDQQIKAVKEQLRQVPNKGIGYGLRRYRGNAGTSPAGTPAQVRFNYLGQFDHELNNGLFSYCHQPTGADTDPANAMTARLEINAMVVGGALRLEVSYNRKAHQTSTIDWFTDALLRHLERILEHLRQEEAVYFTPSDFDAVRLDQEELDALF